jgi:hypothetical protein
MILARIFLPFKPFRQANRALGVLAYHHFLVFYVKITGIKVRRTFF